MGSILCYHFKNSAITNLFIKIIFKQLTLKGGKNEVQRNYD